MRDDIGRADPLWAAPDMLFGNLFHAVQTAAGFEDSKTFCDMVPLAPPAEILRRWHDHAPTSQGDLRAFVSRHFGPPPPLRTPEAPNPAMPIGQHIAAMWDTLTRPPTVAEPWGSQLPLENSYVVPGGRFREVYYWDSYFTMLGLKADGRIELLEGMIDNFVALIERHGHVPNGSRSYYLSRSQPPFLALMLGLSEARDSAVRKRRLHALKTEHRFWMRGQGGLSYDGAAEHVVRLANGDILNRYWDANCTPRPESYAEDLATAQGSGRDAAELFRDIRAAAESGWDFSSRWLADGRTLATIRTTCIVPVDLNCLLCAAERHIAQEAEDLDEATTAAAFAEAADRRAESIRRHLWHAGEGRFGDLLWQEGRIVPGVTAATLFPLFVGLASPTEAATVARTARRDLLAPGGLRTTCVESGEQWDSPNGWAPLQWIAVAGLRRYGETELADEIARRWLTTVQDDYDRSGILREKYDIENGGHARGGEYPNQTGFGWTNGVYRALSEDACARRDRPLNYTV